MTAYRLIRNSLLTGVCIGLLTGCSWLEDWPPGSNGADTAKQAQAEAPPRAKVMKTADSTWIEPAQQAQDVGTMAAMPPNTAPMDGDTAQRLAALEAELGKIRNDLNMIMPALTKIAAAQGSLQNSLQGIEPAAGGNMAAAGAPQPVTPAAQQSQQRGQQARSQQPQTQQIRQQTAASTDSAYAPEPGTVDWYEQQERAARQKPNRANVQPASATQGQKTAAQPQAHVQQASYGAAGATVKNVRFGEHPDKTRVVLDTSDNVSFRYDLDNTEQILMISMPSAEWQGAEDMDVSNSILVSSYKVVPDGSGGQQMIVQLRQPVKVLWAQALPPAANQGHRIVIDLAPL